MERNSLTQYWFFSGINDDFDKYFVHMQFVSRRDNYLALLLSLHLNIFAKLS